MKYRILVLLAAVFISAIPFACTNNYSVGPTASATLTFTPTPTPNCPNTGGWWSTVTCVSGITWGDAFVANYSNNGVYQYGATLSLAVNCVPETTDTVTLTGPGVSLPLLYSGVSIIGSTTYGLYESAATVGSLTPGSTYTLTSATSLGTAYASLVLPPAISMTGGVPVWAGGGCCQVNKFEMQGTNYSIYTGQGFDTCSGAPLGSPVLCNSPCTYDAGEQFLNSTTNITGGSGSYVLANGAFVTL